MLHHKQHFLSGLIACSILLLLAFNSPHARHSRTANTFPLELDHVLVWVTKGAPEAKALEDAGLQMYGEITKHKGQGTASKVFIFENAYLELIWVDDEQAASKNAARTGIDMNVRARWKQSGASPFGIGLHRVAGTTKAIPFPVIEYWAEWMKPNTSIQFARVVSSYKELMYFVVPDYIAIPDATTRESLQQRSPDYAKMMMHRLGISRLTNVRVLTVENKLTLTAKKLSRGGVVKIEHGVAPLMELTFDGSVQKKDIDLRPQLPVILRY